MAAVGHFGYPKFTLVHTFRAILDQYRFFFGKFWQNGCQWPFWMSENHFPSHFYPFHIDTQLYFFLKFFDKMADVGHFGCPNFTFDRISGHFRLIRNFEIFEIFDKMADIHSLRVTLWTYVSDLTWPDLTWPHLTSPTIKWLQVGTSGYKWLQVATSGYKWFYGHFRSIRNYKYFLKFLTKWLLSVILDIRNSLSIVFLAISDRSAMLDFLNSLSIAILAISFFFFRRPFWMSENHFRSHFWPFLIDRPYWMSKIHFRWHFWPFQIHADLHSFFKFWTCPKITFDHSSCHFRSIRNFFFEFFGQNGRRRPFWIGRQCQLSNSSEIFGWIMHVSSLKNVA